MGVYSDSLRREVKLERMRPEEVAAAKARRPAIYVPFGSIEWHSYHNAVGLDTLKAHEQLVGLAAEAGGVVYPPVYFGSGGGHTKWPSSFMVDPEPMTAIKAILLSGHYPNRSEYMDRAIERYRESGGRMDVLALVENQAPDVGGDHAAKFETSYMLYLHPEMVSMDRLRTEPQTDIRGPDEKVN